MKKKIYVHLEGADGYDDHTVILRKCDGKSSLRSVLSSFVSKYNLKFPRNELKGAVGLKNDKGRMLDEDSLLGDVDAMSDLFVVVEKEKDVSTASVEEAARLMLCKDFGRAYRMLEKLMLSDKDDDFDFKTVGEMLKVCEENGALSKIGLSAQDLATAKHARAVGLPLLGFQMLKKYFDAADHFKKQKAYGRAKEIYLEVLKIHDKDFTSLVGLGECFLLGKSRKVKEVLPHLKLLSETYPENFLGWKVYGQALLAAEELEAAFAALKTSAKFCRDQEDLKDILVLLARTMRLRGQPDSALAVAAQVLRSDENDAAALREYGYVMLDKGEDDEALRVAVKLILSKDRSRESKRFSSQALQSPQSIALLVRELNIHHPASADGASYVAKYVKEYGAIAAARALLEKAIDADFSNPSFLLTLLHCYELDLDYGQALSLSRKWLKSNQGKTIEAPGGKRLQFAEVLECLEYAGESQMFKSRMADEQEKGEVSWCSEFELECLGVFFTFAKILYLCGEMGKLAKLIDAIERIREGWEFHRSLMRNEHAYYCCIVRVLQERGSLPHTGRNNDNNNNKLESVFVVGDSHTLPLSWHVCDNGLHFIPKLVTGMKLWHLREEGKFFPKKNFWNTIESIPKGSKVMMVFGEIDCREGLLVCIKKGRYDSLEEGALVVISIFVDVLKKLVKERELTIHIHPVVPVLDPTRHIVEMFNVLLRREVGKVEGVKWLDFYDSLVDPFAENEKKTSKSKFKLKEEFKLDGTHMNPAYIELLEREMKK